VHRRSITQRTTGTKRKLIKNASMQQKKEMKMSGIMLAQFDHSAIPAADACTSSHSHTVGWRWQKERTQSLGCRQLISLLPLGSFIYKESCLLPKLLTTFQSTTSQLASLPSQATYFYSKIDYGQWPPRIHGALLLMLLLQADRSTHSSINTYMLLNTCASSWGL